MQHTLLGKLALALSAGLITIAAFVTDAAAQPATLAQQGRLFDQGSGDPATGTKSVTFSIYAGEGDPTALWSEGHVLDFDDGHFHTELGGATPFDLVFDVVPGEERWIGVVIDGEELLPRQKLGMVPYARHALVANDAVGNIMPQSVGIAGFGAVIDNQGTWVGAPIVSASGGGYDLGIGFNAPSSTFVGNNLSSYGNTPVTVTPSNRILVVANAMPHRTPAGSNLNGYVVASAMPQIGGAPILPPANQGWTYFDFTSSTGYDRQFTSSYTFTNLTAGAYYFTVCGNSYVGTIDFRGPQARAIRF
jgi:hypothetical protein